MHVPITEPTKIVKMNFENLDLKTWVSEYKFKLMAAPHGDWAVFKGADFILEKTIRDTTGIKYHIVVYVYENLKSRTEALQFIATAKFAVEEECMSVFSVEDKWNIPKMYDYFENCWIVSGCPYFELTA